MAKKWAMLQVDSNDKSVYERFKVAGKSGSISKAQKKAERLRNLGKRARVIRKGGEYIVYSRG